MAAGIAVTILESMTSQMGGLVSVEMHFGDHGGTVVKVLCYKTEGRWFDPSWCHWNFSLT